MVIETNAQTKAFFNEVHLELLDHGHARTSGDWHGEASAPPYSRIYYITGGNGELTFPDRTVKLHAGNVCLLPTGISFRYDSTEKMEQLYFHFNLFDAAGYDLLNGCGFCGPFLFQDSEELLRLYHGQQGIQMLLMKQRVLSDLFRFLDHAAFPIKSSRYSPVVWNTMDYIRKNLSLRLRADFLAQRLFLSKSALCKYFKKETGRTLGQYIDDLIMFRAAQLLSRTTLPISAVSDRLGFCDQFYFSRKFSARFGETPSHYRRRNFDSI